MLAASPVQVTEIPIGIVYTAVLVIDELGEKCEYDFIVGDAILLKILKTFFVISVFVFELLLQVNDEQDVFVKHFSLSPLVGSTIVEIFCDIDN